LPVHQQSKSNDNVSEHERDASFESWLNDEPRAKPTKSSNRTTNSKKSSSSKSKSTPAAAPAPVPAANLISFDDDKWANDDDAAWESIDGK